MSLKASIPSFRMEFADGISSYNLCQEIRQNAKKHYGKYRELKVRAEVASRSGNNREAKIDRDASHVELVRSRDLNNQAAQIIYDANNRNLEPNKIILSGLLVNEVKLVLKKRIIYGLSNEELMIIVIFAKKGTNDKHATELETAIKKLCNDAKLNYSEEPQKYGCITIDLTNSLVPESWISSNSHGSSGASVSLQEIRSYEQEQEMELEPALSALRTYDSAEDNDSSCTCFKILTSCL